MAWQIPLSDIDFGPEEITAVEKVLRSRWLTMGEVTKDFEQKFADFCGAKHALAVANGTAALHLACIAAGIQPGDEVIVPSLTFVATANAIRYVGATPVFADINGQDDLNISPDSIRENITPRTKAIIVVHYGGYACAMPRIKQIAEEFGLVVIEDAAHAVGAQLDNTNLGNWGLIGCYSFFSNKNMTTGEGGMLTTNDDAVAERLRKLRSHGMTTLTWDRHHGHAYTYDVTDLGFNYRIDEIRSAIGRVQLEKLPENNKKRQVLTAVYRETFANVIPEIHIPFSQARGVSSCHILPALLPPGINRFSFMGELKTMGIQTSIHYPPIHTFQSYREESYPHVDLSRTEDIAARDVTFPLFPALQEEQIPIIAQAAAAALKQAVVTV
jgi:dTDP-4-amino-4,6-dideoxygalactose transaminase